MKFVSAVTALLAGSVAITACPLALAVEGVDSQKAESVGVVSGLAVGALLGGPPGAVLAAAAGGVIGEQVAVRRHHRVLQAKLAEAENQLATLESANSALQQQQLTLQKRLYERELVASTTLPVPTAPAAQEPLVLHFRTNSAELEPHYQDALLRFVNASEAHPSMVVGITGHADRRGDSTANLLLSQRRVEAVMSALRTLGLEAATYQTVAIGEQQPLTNPSHAETDFFDRRVELRLQSAQAAMLSSTSP